ncbi:MAG: hypothetical protein ABIP75_11080 [Pyrinomonadaceae bacterium]
MKLHRFGISRPRAAAWGLVLALLLPGLAFGQSSSRTHRVRPRTVITRPVVPVAKPAVKLTPPPVPVEAAVSRDNIEAAMGFVCSDRQRDPMGSAPIDLMQAKPSLSLNHPDAIAGAQRARRLLPLAKELTIKSLRAVATEYGFSQQIIDQAALRVQAVTQVKADPDLRDNASVMMSNPRVINFGTIFLVGLPSEEGMISVLSHELTHIADGRGGALAQLFARIGRRASTRVGLKINGQRSEELGCDLIGSTAVQSLVERQTSSEETQRRYARAMEHNCVDSDDTDDEHLSPRNTMRALLALNPSLARVVIGAKTRVGYSRNREMNLIQMGLVR